MKKLLNILPILAVTMSLSALCSCGNSGKPQVDEQALKDSIENAIKDSIRNAEVEKAKNDSIEAYNKLHSKTVVERELKFFCPSMSIQPMKTSGSTCRQTSALPLRNGSTTPMQGYGISLA